MSNITEIQPEGFLRISVLISWVTCDPSGFPSRTRLPTPSPFSGEFCQLISPVGNSILKEPKPDFKFEAQQTAGELKDIYVLFAYRDLIGSKQPAGEKNSNRDCFVLAGTSPKDRAIGEFNLSQKVFKSIYDDCLANKRMQIFDLRFHNDLQRADGFTVECSKEKNSNSNTNQKLRLRSVYDKGAMYIAEVTNRSSMGVTEYIEKMNFDPVLKYSNNCHDPFDRNFNEYLDKNTARLQGGKQNLKVEFVPRVKAISMGGLSRVIKIPIE